MKLYFSPEACSLAPHIVLRELGIPFDLVKVDHPTKTTSDGENYMTINPAGYIAALRLENGEVLTEGSAILEYLADLRPEANLAPPLGSWERVRLRERLSFLSCELNSTMNPLFKPIPEDVKDIFRTKLFKRFDLLNDILVEKPYLCGQSYGVVDAYLYTLLRWTKWFEIDLLCWPGLVAFQERIAARPAAQAALEAELAFGKHATD